MNFLDTVRSGIEALIGHRLRSCLTVLGLLIGVAAVILTVGLGQGASSSVSNAISSLGSNLLIVTPGSATANGVRGGFGSASTLTLSDALALSSNTVAPDIAGVAPTMSQSEQLDANGESWTTTVTGTSDQFLTVRNRKLSSGAFFSADQVKDNAAVAVLGSTTASQLSLGVGSSVTVNGVSLEVIGVLESAGTSGTTNQDDLVLVPVTTAQRQIFGSTSESVQNIYLTATSEDRLSAAYQESMPTLLALHKISDPASADFTVTTQESLLSTATSVNRTLTVLLVGIAAISLLVGGIGVMNIMLVAVAERVREIGLRKALGATPRAIRRQFLVEASVLGLIGGVAGIALGVAGAELIPHFVANTVIVLSVPAIIGSVVVSVGIGLIFGVYPATRAAKLAPIDALRSE